MDFRRIVSVLGDAGVDFVVVGGVSAVLHGVPTSTFDLDIVPSLKDSNRTRMLDALHGLEACFREHLPKRLLPTDSDLAAGGHLLLMTSAGPLDVLGQIAGGLGYADLMERSCAMTIAGREIHVLELRALIEIKEKLGRDKDLAQLPVLRRTLQERSDLG